MSQPVANGPERRWTGLAAYLAGVAALAVVLTLSGAYDTDGLGVAHRLALWLVVGGLLVGQVVLIERALTQLLPRRAAFRLVSGVLPKARDPFWEFLIFLAPLVGALGGFVLFLRARRHRTGDAGRQGRGGDRADRDAAGHCRAVTGAERRDGRIRTLARRPRPLCPCQ